MVVGFGTNEVLVVDRLVEFCKFVELSWYPEWVVDEFKLEWVKLAGSLEGLLVIMEPGAIDEGLAVEVLNVLFASSFE